MSVPSVTYRWLAGIRTQADSVTRSTEPVTDTVESGDAADDDGRAEANELFTPGRRHTPASYIAHTDRYDTSQAVARIMKIYWMDRSMYFEQAVKDNDRHRARLSYKEQYTEKLIQNNNKVQEELDRYAEQLAKQDGGSGKIGAVQMPAAFDSVG